MRSVFCALLCLGLLVGSTGCSSTAAPKETIQKGIKKGVKKAAYYVRDREKDYQSTRLVPYLKVPEGLSDLDASKEHTLPKGAPSSKTELSLVPPGVLN